MRVRLIVTAGILVAAWLAIGAFNSLLVAPAAPVASASGPMRHATGQGSGADPVVQPEAEPGRSAPVVEQPAPTLPADPTLAPRDTELPTAVDAEPPAAERPTFRVRFAMPGDQPLPTLDSIVICPYGREEISFTPGDQTAAREAGISVGWNPADGTMTIVGLPADTFTLYAFFAGCERELVSLYDQNPDRGTQVLDVPDPLRTLEVVVQDADGYVLADAEVTLFDALEEARSRRLRERQVAYRVPPAPALVAGTTDAGGRAMLEAELPAFVSVRVVVGEQTGAAVARFESGQLTTRVVVVLGQEAPAAEGDLTSLPGDRR